MRRLTALLVGAVAALGVVLLPAGAAAAATPAASAAHVVPSDYCGNHPEDCVGS